MAEAQQGQVISSDHKDNYYRNHLKSLIIDFISSLSKEKSWMKHVKDISVVADVVYFAVTTLSGNQTMGEEHNNLLQVNKDKKSLPSKFKSALMVVFHVILPHTIDKSTAYLTTLTQRNQALNDVKKQKILIVIKIFGGFLKFLEKFNSILFYLNGAYYHISKRLTNLLYLQTRPLKFDSTYNKAYSLLGWLMLLQSLMASSAYVYNAWKNSNNNINLFIYNLLGVNFLVSATSDDNTLPKSSTLAGLSSYLLSHVQHLQQAASKDQDQRIQQTQQNIFKKSSKKNDLNKIPTTSQSSPPTASTSLFNTNNNNSTNSNIDNNTTPTNKVESNRNNNSDSSIYNKNNRNAENKTAMGKRRVCLLCCHQLHSPTSTMCGHVFCYHCITQWCLRKAECPMCKKEVVLSRLVFLKNFA